MKLLITALAIFLIFLVMAILFAYVQFAYYTPNGFGEVNPDSVTKPVVLSGFSLLGILSKSIFSALDEKDKREDTLSILAKTLSLPGMLRALIISPIVIISFYNSLQEIGDLFVIALIAYQNGFFFETVLQARESKANKDAETN